MPLMTFGIIGFEMKIFLIHAVEFHPCSFHYLPLEYRYCKIMHKYHAGF